MVVSIILILIYFVLHCSIMYELLKNYNDIPTSLYYQKISRLQKEIEKLTEKKQSLIFECQTFNPNKFNSITQWNKAKHYMKNSHFKLENIEKVIKAKKKEIKRVKIHIRIEDDSNKY